MLNFRRVSAISLLTDLEDLVYQENLGESIRLKDFSCTIINKLRRLCRFVRCSVLSIVCRDGKMLRFCSLSNRVEYLYDSFV